MTKADIVNEIHSDTGLPKSDVALVVDAFMKITKNNIANNNSIFMRGFGTFKVKKRAKKTGRNITKNIPVIIPEHFIPEFKPSKEFIKLVKDSINPKK